MAANRRPLARAHSGIAVGGGLWLDRKGRRFLGEKRIALLESIDAVGSITGAAKAVGLSYKGAWDAVDAINNTAEQAVVSRSTGGKHGGGSRLTDYGHTLVRLFRDFGIERRPRLAPRPAV